MTREQKRQKYKQDVAPYIAEGLIREVYEGDGFTITCVVNSAYAIFLHGIINKENGLTVGFHIRGKEFEIFMDEPTMENFKWLNYACQQRGENRAFSFTPQLAHKFRELKRRLDAEKKVEVDLQLEQRLVETAKRKQRRPGIFKKILSKN